MHRFANPGRFLRLVEPILPWLGGATLLTLAVGVYLALFVAPADYQQSETVRIMFVHVPAAWMAMFTYSCMAVASACALIWRHPLADFSAKAMAPVGAAFTFLALITGSLWGKPMWGTWWEWDARMTSVLILFFLYLGYMAIWNAFDDHGKAARAAAILSLVGAINLPIIKFSVDWWNTLHQPASVTRLDAPAIHSSILWPLLVMAIGYNLLGLFLSLYRTRNEILARKLEALTRAQAEQTPRPTSNQTNQLPIGGSANG